MDAARLSGELQAFALGFPGAWADTPWEDDPVTKVGTKIFAFHGGREPTLTVKLPESADHALSLPRAQPSAYGLGRHGWITIALSGVRDADAEVLFDFVEESYRAVAPKKLVKELDERDE